MVQPHKCVNCGDLVNKLGRHGLSFSKPRGTRPRHFLCNDIIKRSLAQAGYPADLEPENLSRLDGKQSDGLSLISWTRGINLLWDFTCRDTLCSSYSSKTSRQAGKAADITKKEKEDKYRELSKDYFFTPVAAETMRSWGQLSTKFLQNLGSRIQASTKEKRSTSWLYQQLGINIPKRKCHKHFSNPTKVKETRQTIPLSVMVVTKNVILLNTLI